MIAREWKCLCPMEKRDAFLHHLYATGVSETSGLPDFLGYHILTRETDGMVEVTLVTYWESLDSVALFAGGDIDRAVLYPGDEVFEIIPETVVRHYEVVGSDFPAP